MKNLLIVVFILLSSLSRSFAQDKSGFLLAEQWPSGIGYTGGLYFPTGVSFQAQYIGLEKNWILTGYSFLVKNWSIDLNAGVVVGRADAKMSNLSFQCNSVYGGRHSKFNFLLANEFDLGLGSNVDFAWGFHQYLFRATKNFFAGACAEYYIETEKQKLINLKPGPMIKYWLTDNIALSLSPRGIMEGRNLKVGGFKWNNIYLNLLYQFKF